MTAYEMLLNLVKEYFVDLGYNPQIVADFFTSINFAELASIKLANANLMIKNKTDHSSHQTHIAITGEMIDFFYSPEEFSQLDTETIAFRDVVVSRDNIKALKNIDVYVKDTFDIPVTEGRLTVGKRTQKQLQLSKKNSLNSQCFNELRLGLYENDLLILLKARKNKKIWAIGIPQTFYLEVIPKYAEKFEANTYLRIPLR